MCVGPFKPPKLPKLPEPRPTAPAPEQTAKGVVTGRRRKRSQGNVLSARGGRKGGNTGIDSLRIGLGSGRGDLNY
jgi:hypothetical protein|tara:strand:+ start:1738 stop:1962 length:225 start_codon:yes stop_codon:yes gene_type:complete